MTRLEFLFLKWNAKPSDNAFRGELLRGFYPIG